MFYKKKKTKKNCWEETFGPLYIFPLFSSTITVPILKASLTTLPPIQNNFPAWITRRARESARKKTRESPKKTLATRKQRGLLSVRVAETRNDGASGM